MEEVLLKAIVENNFDQISSSESSCDNWIFESSDEDYDEKPSKKVKIIRYVEDIIQNYGNDEFKDHFRMYRSTAYKLIGLFDISNQKPVYKKGRENITSEKSVLLSLWYMSNKETFRQVSDRFNVSLSCAQGVLLRVVEYFLSIKNKIIQWPSNERKLIIVEGFRAKANIPDIIGAVDGSHIEILKPKINQDSYINRKGYHSILLQGIVDHEKKFVDVFCGEPGSLHDARLMRKSGIYAKIMEDPNIMGGCRLLGDSAYPSLPWIITPLIDTGHLNQHERQFNTRHSISRVVVENAFGLLKGRFRRIQQLNNFNVEICSKLVMTACVLHNICIDNGDSLEGVTGDFNQPKPLIANEFL